MHCVLSVRNEIENIVPGACDSLKACTTLVLVALQKNGHFLGLVTYLSLSFHGENDS